jgi:TonB family protein
LQAPQADQDQAFLSRDPVGMGRIGDPPAFWTGPRGEDGSGGQVGGPNSAANPAHAPSPEVAAAPANPAHSPSADAPSANQAKASDAPSPTQPPRQSIVRGPEPETPSITPPADVTPPPANTAMVGTATVDLKQPPVDEVKAKGPLVQVASTADGSLQLAPFEGPPALPVPPSSTAPPTKPDAPPDHAAVALAPEVKAPVAAVAAPPPPAVDIALPKPPEKQATPMQIAMAQSPQPMLVAPAPAIVTTGDARAPGRDRAAADPAQESDSESDPFSTKEVAIMRDGRLEVREGRKVKTTRPHFLPGSEAAFYANPDATLVLKISIDETGKVKSADIIRSAGSVEIDQPCRVAVYDWWFEPTHNKAGKPVPDVVVFTIHFR